MASFLDLARQVKGLLLPERGGTGNSLALAKGVYMTGQNRTGSTLARMTLVKLLGTWDDGRVTPVTTAEDTAAFGVVIGGFTSDDGTRINPYAGAADGKPVAVLIAGITDVLISEAVTRGQYAYASGTSGQAKSSATRSAGAFGVFVESATSGSARVALGMRATNTGSEKVASYGTAQDTTDLVTIDVGNALHEHGDADTVQLEVREEDIAIGAGQVAVADVLGRFTAHSPASGTETLRPTSDADKSSSGITYSTGTDAYALVDEAVLDTTDYYHFTGASTYVSHGFPASTLGSNVRITSVTLHADVTNAAPAGNGSLQMRDPATSTRYDVGSAIAQSASGEVTAVLTSRPWDSRSWTIGDVRHLQGGIRGPTSTPNLRTRQFWITVEWTWPDNVEEVLEQIGASLAGIWRPLMDGAVPGTVIVDGGSRQAIMAFGPQ